MEEYFEARCPYCGEILDLEVEDDVIGEMIWDCNVCCNPCQVRVLRDVWGDRQIEVARTD